VSGPLGREERSIVEDQSPLHRAVSEVKRHWRWGREQGFNRIVEEAELHPIARVQAGISRWQWRRRHPVKPGSALPVFVVGLQRSGTNMVIQCLQRSPEVEVHNENDRRCFVRYRLRSDDVIKEVIGQSRHRCVLLKPLCDSHRVPDLLDHLGGPVPGKAIWIYRDVDARVRSAVSKFGDVNLRVLAEIASGGGRDRWQAQGLSEEMLHLLGEFDYDRLSPESAAALFWYVRNSLYFSLGLDKRDDVLLSSYERFLAAPERGVQRLCDFVGIQGHRTLGSSLDPARSRPLPPLDLDPRVRRLCDQLDERLAASSGR